MTAHDSGEILANMLFLSQASLKTLEDDVTHAEAACADRFNAAMNREEAIEAAFQEFARHHPWGIVKGRLVRMNNVKNQDARDAKRRALSDIAHRLTLLEKDGLTLVMAKEEAVKESERAFEAQETDLQRRFLYKIESAESSALEPSRADAHELLVTNDPQDIKTVKARIARARKEGYDAELTLLSSSRNDRVTRVKAQAETAHALSLAALEARSVYERKHYNNCFGRSILLLELETQDEIARFQIEKAWFAHQELLARERVALARPIDEALARDEAKALTTWHKALFTLAQATEELLSSLRDPAFQVLEELYAHEQAQSLELPVVKTSFGFTTQPLTSFLRAVSMGEGPAGPRDARSRLALLFEELAFPLATYREHYTRHVLQEKTKNDDVARARLEERVAKSREWDKLGPAEAASITRKITSCRADAEREMTRLKKEHTLRLAEDQKQTDEGRKKLMREREARVKREIKKSKRAFARYKRYIRRKKARCQ